jgi:tetratricopeptide (TPR) repeat protein
LMGSLPKARDDLLAAAQNGGDVGLVSAALGNLYGKMGDIAKAAEIFREAYQRTKQPEFQYALALALQRMGRDLDALPEFRRAVDLFPENARIRYEYGKSLQRAGHIKEARQQFERSRAIDPNLADTWYALARLYRSLGHAVMAQQAAQEFLIARKKQGALQVTVP